VADPDEISLIDEITELAEQTPFAPFAIVMASGYRYEVGPEDTVYSRQARAHADAPSRRSRHAPQQSD
jgi:hypothetical protein